MCATSPMWTTRSTRRAAESGRSIGEITGETTQWYLDDMAEVGALEPTHMPRATGYIGEMIAMIEALIAKEPCLCGRGPCALSGALL